MSNPNGIQGYDGQVGDDREECENCQNPHPVRAYAEFIDWGRWRPRILCSDCAAERGYPTRKLALQPMRIAPGGKLSQNEFGWVATIQILTDNHFKDGVCLYCGEHRSNHPPTEMRLPAPGAHEWRIVSGCAPDSDMTWDPADIQESVTDQHTYIPFLPGVEASSHRITRTEMLIGLYDPEEEG